ncbi:MAG: Stp1/IreP family PP2C-type Ser/Thr phosphatase [Candidatus Sericytochromatia bacterium]|nr:Stp1/IreP family PP2C-type Ser/Thr phosphatase [Candidatus Sericytochromatia bacterium]
MRVGYLTDIGKVREINQDYLFADKELGLFMVADGMGGHAAGEKASQTAVQIISGHLTQATQQATNGQLIDEIQGAIQEANRQIINASMEDASMRGMGTTATVIVTKDDLMYVGHVGDSRAYLIRHRRIDQITDDHSIVAQLVRARAITPQEAARHPYRNVITRCLGMQVDLEADTQQRELKPGDRLLICSDGLSGLVSDDEMLQYVVSSQDPQQTCHDLVQLALERGGSDNISVVLVFNDD